MNDFTLLHKKNHTVTDANLPIIISCPAGDLLCKHTELLTTEDTPSSPSSLRAVSRQAVVRVFCVASVDPVQARCWPRVATWAFEIVK